MLHSLLGHRQHALRKPPRLRGHRGRVLTGATLFIWIHGKCVARVLRPNDSAEHLLSARHLLAPRDKGRCSSNLGDDLRRSFGSRTAGFSAPVAPHVCYLRSSRLGKWLHHPLSQTVLKTSLTLMPPRTNRQTNQTSVSSISRIYLRSTYSSLSLLQSLFSQPHHCFRTHITSFHWPRTAVTMQDRRPASLPSQNTELLKARTSTCSFLQHALIKCLLSY